jgi:heat shock protein HslJ
MDAAASSIGALALAGAACTSIVVDSRSFEGTRWHVSAIDRVPTPASGDYRVEFRNGHISGRFGCNSWGGAYSASGEALGATRIIATQMGCPEPAMSFERNGFAILSQPVRVTFEGERRLLLSNGKGSILLELETSK